MEPSTAPSGPARPVWIVPTIAAALSLLFIGVIALETRDHGTAAPPTSSTTTSTTRPPAGDVPPGNAGNPFPIGTSGVLGGWRVTVVSSSRAGDGVTASLQLIWDGKEGAPQGDAGDAKTLVLRLVDAVGKAHRVGGAGCAASPIADLTSLPPFDVGQTATVPMCWTVTGLGQNPVGMVAGLTTSHDTTVFQLG